jgi:hypothetical protein
MHALFKGGEENKICSERINPLLQQHAGLYLVVKKNT